MTVQVKITDATFSMLLSGLFFTYHDAEIYSIPSYVWLMLANELEKYLPDWRYDVQSLEEWMQYDLIITLKEVCTGQEINDFKKNSIYLEVMNGNATLIVTGDIIWLDT